MCDHINDKIVNILNNKYISKKLYDKCLVNNPKLGRFRILIKLHKLPKLSTRPIVNFLDVNIYFNYPFNKIIVSLYVKPTQNCSFLLQNSNHPDFIFKNTPKSILIRIRRNCTNLTIFCIFPIFIFIIF